MKYTLLVGRWQPLHKGHCALIETVLAEGKKPLIAIRDTEISKENPYTYLERKRMIRGVYGNRVKVMKIPDIEEVCYGRNVGYKIREIRLDKEIESISATAIRAIKLV